MAASAVSLVVACAVEWVSAYTVRRVAASAVAWADAVVSVSEMSAALWLM